VRYAVFGPLERTTYGEPGVLETLGRKVHDAGGTAIYAYVPPPGKPAPPPARPALGG
jgi:hypothetical protein